MVPKSFLSSAKVITGLEPAMALPSGMLTRSVLTGSSFASFPLQEAKNKVPEVKRATMNVEFAFRKSFILKRIIFLDAKVKKSSKCRDAKLCVPGKSSLQKSPAGFSDL